MFAAGMLWVKNVVRLNNKITGLICFSCLCSEQLYSLVTGLVIEEHPRWFLYIMSANTAAVILCLLLMHFIASKTSWPYFEVKLSCVRLMFANSKEKKRIV